MKTTVEIADPLFREARRAAERDGTTLRELIELGLRRVLDERRTRTREPYKLPDCSNRHAKLQPWIREGDWTQIREIIYGFDSLPDGKDGGGK
jgi:hypothetical protein